MHRTTGHSIPFTDRNGRTFGSLRELTGLCIGVPGCVGILWHVEIFSDGRAKLTNVYTGSSHIDHGKAIRERINEGWLEVAPRTVFARCVAE